MTGISCSTVISCVAVGASLDNGALVWRTIDGESWTEVQIGDAPGLSAVSCTPEGNCAAVGQHALSSTDGGSTWTSRPLGRDSDRLFSVACDSDRGCLATGWSIPRMAVTPLAVGEAHPGDDWSVQGSPQISGYFTVLSWTPAADCIGLTVLTGGIGVIRHG